MGVETTDIHVPRPQGIYSPPWNRTEHALMSLMADERALPDRGFVRHAFDVIAYLEGRIECYPHIEVRVKGSV